MSDARCRLYLITPPRLDDVVAFAAVLNEAFGAGDVACLQLRLKDASDEDVLAAAEAIKPICHAHDVALIINDRPDLACKANADGVHIGQKDASYGQAREAFGAEGIVGVTCHASRHLAVEAADAGADYVAFGAFFETATKAAETHAEIELLTWWAETMNTQCVAIGGITPENADPLVTAGADFLAVSNGIWGYKDGPASAVAEFNRIFDRTFANGTMKV